MFFEELSIEGSLIKNLMNTCVTQPIEKQSNPYSKKANLITKKTSNYSKKDSTISKADRNISRTSEICPSLLQENGLYLLLENGYRIKL